MALFADDVVKAAVNAELEAIAKEADAIAGIAREQARRADAAGFLRSAYAYSEKADSMEGFARVIRGRIRT